MMKIADDPFNLTFDNPSMVDSGTSGRHEQGTP